MAEEKHHHHHHHHHHEKVKKEKSSHKHRHVDPNWIPRSDSFPIAGTQRGLELLRDNAKAKIAYSAGSGVSLSATVFAFVKSVVAMTSEYLTITSSRTEMVLLLSISEVAKRSSRHLSLKTASTISMGALDVLYELKFENEETASKWEDLLKVHTRHGANHGTSFSPYVRKSNARAFVGGSEYFPVLADALRSAEREIMIADWWLTPEVYLKRDGQALDPHWRLDNILSDKAKEGIQVRVIVYREVPATVELASKRVKKYLQAMDANIKVECMPVRTAGLKDTCKDYFYYSHHQKFVVIDRSVAFVGGIDLAFGRYNVPGSCLVDHDKTFFPGKDYYNPSIGAPSNVHEAFDDQFSRAENPRMPWQDVQICIDGEAAKDVALNFIQRWNINILRKPKDARCLLIPDYWTDNPSTWNSDVIITVQKANDLANADIGGKSDPYVTVTCAHEGHPVLERTGRHRVAPQMDTLDPEWNAEFIFPKSGPLDITLKVYDSDFNAASKVCEKAILGDMIQTGMSAVANASTVGDDDFLGIATFSVDPSTLVPGAKATAYTSNVKKGKKKGILIKRATGTNKGTVTITASVPVTKSSVHVSRTWPVGVQVLRSISHWSAGVVNHECSLYQQYLNLIATAKHFIYIESQFFISNTAPTVNNEIATALIARIEKAVATKSIFRVIIIVPLHPEGNPLDSTTQAVLYWQNRTLSGEQNDGFFSILQAKCPGVDLSEYITFFSLYKHTIVPQSGEVFHHLVYVHTKLIIVDDRQMIIGSQNINDRSLLGNRDSELGVLVHDTPLVPNTFNGEEFPVSEFIQNFRTRLWKEHLGGDKASMASYKDATSDAVYKKIFLGRAKKNTRILNSVFPRMPQNKITTIAQLATLNAEKQQQPSLEQSKELMSVKGTLVLYPTHFLIDSLADMRHAISDTIFQ